MQCRSPTSVHRPCKAAKNVHAAPALPASICRPVARGHSGSSMSVITVGVRREDHRLLDAASPHSAAALTSLGSQMRMCTDCA